MVNGDEARLRSVTCVSFLSPYVFGAPYFVYRNSYFRRYINIYEDCTHDRFFVEGEKKAACLLPQILHYQTTTLSLVAPTISIKPLFIRCNTMGSKEEMVVGHILFIFNNKKKHYDTLLRPWILRSYHSNGTKIAT